MEDRRKYSIFCRPSVMKGFMNEIGKKWGCMYGAKSLEIENALNKAIVELRNIRTESKHTHTSAPKRDEILLLNGRLFNHLIMDADRDPNTKFTKREFLDAIKLIENLTDDRPAKDRLHLLIAGKFCVEIDEGIKGYTKAIRFKSGYDSDDNNIVVAKPSNKRALDKQTADDILRKYEVVDEKKQFEDIPEVDY